MTEWRDIATAPRDGTRMDVMFEPFTAERDRMGSMAEFYVPGSTNRKNPSPPVIESVEFSNRSFRPVTEDGTRLHGIISVVLTHWRPAKPLPHNGIEP